MARGFKPHKNKGQKFKNKKFKSKKNNKRKHHEQPYEKNEEIEPKKPKFHPKPEPVTSSESEESENEQVFNQFVTTFSKNKKGLQPAIQSSSESDEDETEPEGVEEEEEEIAEEESEEDEIDEIVIEDKELDQDLDPITDTFVKHFNYSLSEQFLEDVQSPDRTSTNTNWPSLGNLQFQIPEKTKHEVDKKLLDDTVYAEPGSVPSVIKLTENFDLTKIGVKSQIAGNVKEANKGNLPEGSKYPFSGLQNELFSIINNYQDLNYGERSFENGEEIRFVYTLHAVNHVLKTRIKILHHNAKIGKNKTTDIPDEFRDQGLVRPKILIVVPFRDSVLKIVQNIIQILVPNDEGGQVMNKLRFMEDFSGGELQMPKKNPKPDDYQKLFSGNTGDDFRIGLSITKKTVKLYSEFYSSDIIIASPLGLRMIVGAQGEEERDYDFLSSIEVLVLDQCEQFLMQNWDHFLHVMDHLHLQPKSSHGTDFSRIRMWSINGWAKYYRQSLIFSSYPQPEINAFFNKKCHNYAGKVKVTNPVSKGTICKVFTQVPQVFNKFTPNNVQEMADKRFDFFVNKILPQYRDTLMKHTLIYVPSYFDYVRVRNYFKQNDVSFVQVCEYSKDEKIARARDKFFHGESHFLLYSERFHHFRRIRLKGVRHIIFYQPPTIPHFYPELCNFMLESNQNKKSNKNLSEMSVTIIYCKYDLIYLNSIVGTDRTSIMFNSEKSTHMFITGE